MKNFKRRDEQSYAEGYANGSRETAKFYILQMSRKGLDTTEIAKILDISENSIRAISIGPANG